MGWLFEDFKFTSTAFWNPEDVTKCMFSEGNVRALQTANEH